MTPSITDAWQRVANGLADLRMNAYKYGLPVVTRDNFAHIYSIQSTRNVFVDLDGHIRSMPFDTKRDGIWYFDGQVFYQKKGRV